MTTTTEGDALIQQIGALFNQIRFYEFPRLTVETVTDDGETYNALRCPRCGNIVEGEDLYAVDFSERWSRAEDIGDWEIDHGRLTFDGGDDDYGSTVYYRHDDHAVSLPELWVESWR